MAEPHRGLTRRALLATGSVGAAGVVVGAAGGTALGRDASAEDPGARTVAFRGVHQAGVTTPPQDHGVLVAFDLVDGVDADALRRLLTIWTDDVERLMSGRPGLADTEPELSLRPSGLTVTLAVGAGAVAAAGVEVPSWLGPLPDFEIDRLEDRWNGGDLLLQVCGDDELAVSHAVRLLTKEARTFVTVRWVQRGFRGPLRQDRMPRNLMGQVDGTANPGPAEHDALVWRDADDGGPAWLVGGTTMVVRRISMDLDTWDEIDRPARERTIGRRLDDGRPLTGGRLEDDPDLSAVDENGLEVIDPFAHVRRARPNDRKQRILRRPYNYDDPPPAGALTDAGLVFVSFQADVERQFLPIQRRLAELDLLNQWTTPVGSAVFAVLPGARRGEILGQPLLS
ncbi:MULTISPECIES: Dyp-type peroxidase [unclassified Aeromicrobium]|uniref:Dyp-type peroxidase n=1 Tax=unclassified Aeromicrobium TaxID=2633570 RepID=UPI002889A45F|nr:MULTISPECIES: Dyp-type peroxidase [unclassified Aeromicrobium]